MNGLNRYKEMLQGAPVDFVPRIPIVMQFAAEYIGKRYGDLTAGYEVLTEANIRCTKDFAFDQLSTISDPYRETQGFGAEIEFLPDSVPKCLTVPLENSPDISLLRKPDPFKSARMLDRINAIRLYQRKYAGEYSILGWVEGPAAEAATLRTVQNYLMDLLTDPDYSAELMDICLENAINFAVAQLDAGADTIGIGDAIASQISPEIYEKLIQPREKKLIQAIQKKGGIARLHICGNISHLLPGIADLQTDILDVDHMVDMKTVRNTVGNKTALAGNIDPVQKIRMGTPQQIRAEIEEIYRTVGNPYLVNAGCEIPSGTPPENLLALCKPLAWQKN